MSFANRIELLSPAGNMERLRFALHYGADAVYLSGKAFGLRAFADNFSQNEMKEAIAFTHARGKKAYVTVNCFAREAELGPVAEWLESVYESGADAAIVSEAGVIRLAKRHAPNLPLHLSTQASTLNSEAVLFWRDQGVKRIILARELSRAEIAKIRGACKDIELETFVHGAMCIAYSGRCVLSNYMTNGERESNAGACTQPCRWEYDVVERKRPGEYMPVKEDERGAYVFNSRDLSLLEHVGELMDDRYKRLPPRHRRAHVGRIDAGRAGRAKARAFNRQPQAVYHGVFLRRFRPESTDRHGGVLTGYGAFGYRARIRRKEKGCAHFAAQPVFRGRRAGAGFAKYARAKANRARNAQY